MAEFYEPGEPVPDREPAEGTEPFHVLAYFAHGHELPMTVYAADKAGAELLWRERLQDPTWRGILEGWGEPEQVEVFTLEEWLTRE